MNLNKLILLCCAIATIGSAAAQWKPAGDKIKTVWAEKVNPSSVLPEYPRPQMERSAWMNLNGLWDYAIKPVGQAEPAAFDGQILVPFAVESSLSGVQKAVGQSNELWYKRTFTVPTTWSKENIILNFDAVDWKTDVFVNDILIGSHQGGYTPFSFDITPYLTGKGPQKLVVRVWDPTDRGYQPAGKQAVDPSGIFYTAVTGIWQTVWIEPVTPEHVTAVKAIPDVDNNTLKVTVDGSAKCKANIVVVKLLDKGQVVATAKGIQGTELRLPVQNAKLWSPDDPYLYDLQVSMLKAGKVIDNVKSYTAMRKISAERDESGIMRLQLNNKNIFMYGPLDQGWWPDGLYTAPTDEALRFDVQKTKDFGYNMIRKHVKVEPARWYYHCAQLGIIVWQDMPSGDRGNSWEPNKYNGGTDRSRSTESVSDYYAEWKAEMDMLISEPAVCVWIPFNEGWGQFQTEKVSEWTKAYDPSRLVNPASGGNFRNTGDIIDIHHYPNPRMTLSDPLRVNVLGEYGGIGYAVDGHLWWNKRNWGYVQFKSSQEVTEQYVKFSAELKPLVARGFCGAVYTQTTDCEGEVNGLMTYDRKVIKVDEAAVRAANQDVINALK